MRQSETHHVRNGVLAAMWALTAAIAIAGVIESMPETIAIDDVIEAGVIVVLLVGMAGLGVLIVTRTNNRIGWLLWGGGLLFAYQYWAFIRQPGPMEQWLSNSIGYMATLLVVPTLILLFPDGRLPSRRWWAVPWIGIGGATAGMLATLFAPTIYDTDDPAPLAGVLPDAVLTALDTFTSILLIPFIVAVVVSPFIRFRKSDGLQRLQLKMFGFGAAVALAGWLAFSLVGIEGLDPVIPGAVTVMALPLSIAAAIMRYRLYDIDRLISRTVGYAIVTIALALVYVAGAVWLPTQLFGEQSPLFVAGATLAVAALFNPLRRRVVLWVDRRFNRARYDAQHVIAEFNERLKDEIDVDRIAADSISVINATMQPSSVGVWIRQ